MAAYSILGLSPFFGFPRAQVTVFSAVLARCEVISEPRTLFPQVCSVLESLEQEYKREEDWCGGADKLGPNSETDHVTPMISKHLEQKEAFLKVWGQVYWVLVSH